MLPFAALTVVALVALLASEWGGSRRGAWISKPLASTGFLGVAIAAGAAGSGYGRWVLAALLLSWLGDVLLIPRGAPNAFRAGAISFLLGHVAFGGAFLCVGSALGGLAPAAVVASVAAAAALRWLGPHLSRDMRPLVVAYVGVISTMVVLAAGAAVAANAPIVLAGAALFWVSDLAVARDRFVASSPTNRLWGLPLYYGGQLLLAGSVAAV